MSGHYFISICICVHSLFWLFFGRNSTSMHLDKILFNEVQTVHCAHVVIVALIKSKQHRLIGWIDPLQVSMETHKSVYLVSPTPSDRNSHNFFCCFFGFLMFYLGFPAIHSFSRCCFFVTQSLKSNKHFRSHSFSVS